MNDEPLPMIDAPPAGEPSPAAPPAPAPTRKDEIEAKQKRIAKLLEESKCEAVLLFDPANLAWLTGAAICQGIADSHEWPAVYLTAEQRWLVSGSADTQRIFDTYLDGLGFQLKEWPWHWGREQLLADIVQNRKMACDRVLVDSTPLGPAFRRIRLTLTSPERERLKELGAAVAHALEATCRNLEVGQTEQEVAGETAHRLLKHGVTPTEISVAADGRSSRHRRPGVTDARIERACVIYTGGQRRGLHAAAARSVVFGAPDAPPRPEHEVAGRIAASLVAHAKPGAPAGDVLEAGRAVAEANKKESEWFSAPTGHVTGWLPVERPISPTLTYQFAADWAVVWQAGVGSAFVADTWLLGASPIAVTRPESWPIQRIKIGELTLDIPDILVRRG
jgi:Xaa-Pro aminopeptidase